jgi:hypothetical protein
MPLVSLSFLDVYDQTFPVLLYLQVLLIPLEKCRLVEPRTLCKCKYENAQPFL